MIETIDGKAKEIQVIILSPTRELCVQIAKDLKSYAAFVGGMRIVPVYGGADINSQMRSLRKGAHIVVATPGRMIDLIRRKELDISQIQTLVLDEADEMLNMGFKD